MKSLGCIIGLLMAIMQPTIVAHTVIADQAQLPVEWSTENVNTLVVQGETIDQVMGNTAQYSSRRDATGQLYITLAPLSKRFSIFFRTNKNHHFSVLVTPKDSLIGGVTTCVEFKKVFLSKARPKSTVRGQRQSMLASFQQGVVPNGAKAIHPIQKKPIRLTKKVVMIPERQWQIGKTRVQVFKLVNQSRHYFTFEPKRFHDPKGLKIITQKNMLRPDGDWTWAFEEMKRVGHEI